MNNIKKLFDSLFLFFVQDVSAYWITNTRYQDYRSIFKSPEKREALREKLIEMAILSMIIFEKLVLLLIIIILDEDEWAIQEVAIQKKDIL